MGALRPGNAAVVARNAVDICRREPWTGYVERSGVGYDALLNRCLRWIGHSQDRVGSGGVGCFEFAGWTPGYPEVTGYIIPTVWDCARALDRSDLADRAVRMSEWELSVQMESGGFEGLYSGQGQPPVVFNTGQVIRGLLRSWRETDDERYLVAARRAGDWIVTVQESDGGWGATNYRGLKRVYDTYVAAPLADLGIETGVASYSRAAERNCEYALSHQHPNGWFALSDNNPVASTAPITHTLSYTVDGLLETGRLLDRDDFVAAAWSAADRMAGAVDSSGYLPGRLDSRWTPAVGYACLTGSAQLGVILMKRDPSDRRRDVVGRLADFLAYAQHLNGLGRSRSGGLPGSYPIWGRYARLKYPSWATKYFADLLLALRADRAP